MNDFLKNVKFFDTTKRKTRKDLYCGQTKSGKTYLAGTAPAPFIIDTDGSLNGLPREVKNIPFLSLRVKKAEGRSWTLSINGEETDFRPFYIIDQLLRDLTENECKINEYKVKTIVFDGLTSLADLFMYECMLDSAIGRTASIRDGFRSPLEKKPTFDEYGILETKLSLLFTKIDDLELNIIATAGLKMDKDEVSGGIRCFPDILGGFRHDVGHRFDITALLVAEKNKHLFYAGAFSKFSGGIRGEWTGPDQLENTTWDEIGKYIK